MNLVLPLASASAISPVLIVVLCAVAGVGTVLLLPARREATLRKIGGAVVLLAAAIFASTLIRYTAQANDPMGVYFWTFAAIAIFGALRVVTHRRPVYSALYFVLTVFASAGLFVLLWAEFMAAALVLIYAGAILVTYVFVIMLAAQAGGGGELSEADVDSREPVASAVIGFGMMALLLYVIFDRAPAALPVATAATPTADLSVRGLATYLFRNQLVNLELAGVMLTMAMVGAIIIARRRVWSAYEPERPAEQPVTIGDDNPHNIPVSGTTDPRQKAYPEA
jgi:NADH-quinone oxidoreductase subunit J